MPTVWLVFLQGAPGTVPWGCISTFLPDYLHIEGGLSVESSTLVMALFTLGGTLGQLVGGEAGQALYNRSRRLPAALMLVAGAAGAVPMRWLVAEPGASSLWSMGALAALGGFFATQTGPIVRATLSNVTTSEQRGVAFAAFALADDLGKGFGPVWVASLIRALGRPRALATAMLFWLPCAALCGGTALAVDADEERIRHAASREAEADLELVELRAPHTHAPFT